jgi:ribose transport system substrate-binding protein
MFVWMKRKTVKKIPRDYTVDSVARACDILSAFRDTSELVTLGQIAERTDVTKVTVFRILSTLVSKNLVEKVGPRAYRSRFKPFRNRRLSLGYAAQSEVVAFISTVTDSLVAAAKDNDIDLIVLNNLASRKVALRNVDFLIERKVDVAIEFQRISDIAPEIGERFRRAGIPVIAVDNPHPDAVYFGADNYKAGRLGGVHLGRWAVQNWSGKVGEIILIQSAVSPVLEARTLGIYDGITSVLPRGSALPLFRYDTQARYERTLDTVRKHLSRSRCQRILVGAVNDSSALGALEAFREFGREEHCTVAGQDGVIEARQEMRRPNTRLTGTVAHFPETYGERLVRLAIDMAEKRAHPPAVFTVHRLVTPANVDHIYPNDLLMTGKKLRGAVSDQRSRG